MPCDETEGLGHVLTDLKQSTITFYERYRESKDNNTYLQVLDTKQW